MYTSINSFAYILTTLSNTNLTLDALFVWYSCCGLWFI